MNEEVSAESLSELLQCAELGLRLALLHACDRGLSTTYPFGELSLAETRAQPHPSKRKPEIRLIDRVRFPGTHPAQPTCTRTVHHSPDAMGKGGLCTAPTRRSNGASPQPDKPCPFGLMWAMGLRCRPGPDGDTLCPGIWPRVGGRWLLRGPVCTNLAATACLQSPSKLSSAVSGLGWSAQSIRPSPATFRLVGVGRECQAVLSWVGDWRIMPLVVGVRDDQGFFDVNSRSGLAREIICVSGPAPCYVSRHKPVAC